MQRLYLQFYSPSWWCWRCSSARRRCCGGSPTTTRARRNISTSPPSSPARCCPMPMRRSPSSSSAIEALHRKLRFDLALYRPDGTMIAMAGKPPPRFDASRARTGWRRGPGGPNFTLQLPDGRWLVARQVRERTSPTFWITAFLALVALAVAVGAYPVVRGLGRRLERLKAGVEQFGDDLGARVKVEGRDEVAALAAELQPLGPAHRGAGRRPSAAARQLQPRAAHAACPHRRRRLAAGRRRRRQDPRVAEARHRRARPADRGDPAGEPARRPARSRPP